MPWPEVFAAHKNEVAMLKTQSLISMMLAGFLVAASQSALAGNFDVTFTANDGIKIETVKEIVVIDVVYKHYSDWEGFSFDAMPDGLVSELQRENKYLSVLSTHIHRDHFHPEIIGELMDGRTNISAYGPQQVVESIKESFINEHRISKQLNCIGTVNCQSSYVTKGGLKISGISMTHVVGPLEIEHWIDNVAYIVDDGKQTVLHLGDGMLSAENINKIKQRGEKFDLAVIPYWYVMVDRALPMLDQFMATIRPKKVALAHLPVARLEQLKDQVKSLSYQNIIVPAPGEKITM